MENKNLLDYPDETTYYFSEDRQRICFALSSLEKQKESDDYCAVLTIYFDECNLFQCTHKVKRNESCPDLAENGPQILIHDISAYDYVNEKPYSINIGNENRFFIDDSDNNKAQIALSIPKECLNAYDKVRLDITFQFGLVLSNGRKRYRAISKNYEVNVINGYPDSDKPKAEEEEKKSTSKSLARMILSGFAMDFSDEKE